MRLEQMQDERSSISVKKWYIAYCRKSSEPEDRQLQSIPDQVREVKRYCQERNLPLLKIFTESKSGANPDRPVFNEFVSLPKQRNDIKGIVGWMISRYSRNPEDAGKVEGLLWPREVIEEIHDIGNDKIYTDPNDITLKIKNWESANFILDVKKHTARGINSKIEKGWKPGTAPPGYKNNTHMKQGEKTISPGPYFTLMRKLFDYALTGNHSVQDLVVKADDLGIRNSRGKPISKTQMYSILRNPFYTTKFIYAGKLYQGKHKRMLKNEEFELLQEILSGNSKPRNYKHNFPLNGLIRCGECGMMITAQERTKHYKNGTSQVFSYYRCSKKSKTHQCQQPYLATNLLEKQVLAFLSKLEISSLFVQWVGKWLNNERKQENRVKEKSRRSLQRQLDDTREKILAIVETRLTDDSFQAEDVEKVYNRLKLRKTSLREKIANIDTKFDQLNDLTLKTFDFASKARERFENGASEDKKLILRAIGSNLVLTDKKLLVEPKTPFLMIKNALASYPVARTHKRSETQNKCSEAFSVYAPLGE